MAPAMSKERNFAGVYRKRSLAPVVLFDKKQDGASVSWGSIVEVMKTTADLPVVLAVQHSTALVNFDDVYEGCGHLSRLGGRCQRSAQHLWLGCSTQA